MMRMKIRTTSMPQTNGNSNSSELMAAELEIRPGGMLVQKRTDSDHNLVPPPTIRLRVKYAPTYHEINISSQATFGELKKMLVGPTGMHHQDQKLIFKDKERDSKAFLDTSGVKDRSKIVLVEDPISQEKRFLDMRRNAKMGKASKSILDISFEVDRLADRVSALESNINKGGKVVETDLIKLTEFLMNQLLKLDGIVADGDIKSQRKMQVRRVQKYVETLDMLKIKNANPASNGIHKPMQVQQRNGPIMYEQQQEKLSSNGHRNLSLHEQKSSKRSTSGTVVTTKWETFDSNPALISTSSSSTYASTSASNNSVQSKFNWQLF